VESDNIAAAISSTRAFLVENRDAYIAPPTKKAALTDADRDAIDSEATATVKQCGERLGRLKAAVSARGAARDGTQLAHRQQVTVALYERLRACARIVQRQRAFRVRQYARHRGRLVGAAAAAKLAPPARAGSGGGGGGGASAGSGGGGSAAFAAALRATAKKADRAPRGAAHARGFDGLDDDDDMFGGGGGGDGGGDGAGALPPDDFRHENLLLRRTLQNDVEEARRIEAKMVEISQLMATFSEKVVEQSAQIEQIFDNAEKADDLIKQSNDELLQASERQKSGSKVIIFFILLAAAMLMFLDWFDG